MSETSTAAIESRILSTLDFCLSKMSDGLGREFNPDDKKSLSLFRQFCAAMRARMQWLKSYFGTAQGTAAPKTPAGINQNGKYPAQSGVEAQKTSAFLRDNREKTQKNHLNTSHDALSAFPAPGLLMKR